MKKESWKVIAIALVILLVGSLFLNYTEVSKKEKEIDQLESLVSELRMEKLDLQTELFDLNMEFIDYISENGGN